MRSACVCLYGDSFTPDGAYDSTLGLRGRVEVHHLFLPAKRTLGVPPCSMVGSALLAFFAPITLHLWVVEGHLSLRSGTVYVR